MGGALAWTLRRADGVEHRMNRWTNTIPDLIQNPGFLSGDARAIDEALETWLWMKADWEANRESGAFEGVMTPAYAPYPYGLAPSEYGLIVTDFISGRILSLQGYTNLGTLSAPRQFYGKSSEDVFPGSAERIEQMHRENRIISWTFLATRPSVGEALAAFGGVTHVDPSFPGTCRVTVPGTAPIAELTALCDRLQDEAPPHPEQSRIDELRDQASRMSADDSERLKIETALNTVIMAHKADHRPFVNASVTLDLAPFTLEMFQESAAGYQAMRARILELGFELSPSERQAWSDRITWEQAREEEDRDG